MKFTFVVSVLFVLLINNVFGFPELMKKSEELSGVDVDNSLVKTVNLERNQFQRNKLNN